MTAPLHPELATPGLLEAGSVLSSTQVPVGDRAPCNSLNKAVDVLKVRVRHPENPIVRPREKGVPLLSEASSFGISMETECGFWGKKAEPMPEAYTIETSSVFEKKM